MEEIGALLDTEVIISCHWLSNTLQISITDARHRLEDYMKANENQVFASYLLCGMTADGNISFCVTPKTEVESTLKKFSNVRSQQLYSLQRHASENFREQLSAVQYQQADELLNMTHPGSTDFMKNTSGFITPPTNITVKPVGERILSSMNGSVVTPRDATSAYSAGSKLQKVITKTQQSATVEPPVLKSKSSVAATNFFGKGNTTKKVTNAAIKEENIPAAKENHCEAANTTSAAHTKEEEEQQPVMNDNVDEDEEWDDGTGYKTDPKRIQERERVQLEKKRQEMLQLRKQRASETENGSSPDEEEADDDEPSAEGEAADAAEGKKKSASKNLLVRGAMDDYFEDVAIQKYKEAVAAGVDPNTLEQEMAQNGGTGIVEKKKKRKLIEKSHVDERGYFVTSMVYEEVTDDEADMPPVAPFSQSKKPKISTSSEVATTERKSSAPAPGKKQPATAETNKKGNGKSNGQQKNMMSFFAKKL